MRKRQERWYFEPRILIDRPSGIVVRDQREAVVCIIPKNPPRTQVDCELIAQEITAAHNGD